MTNKIIRRFQIPGEMKNDASLIQTRATVHKAILEMMKDSGYVPILDIDPVWETSWHFEKDSYTFTYTWQGEYIGDDAWKYEGRAGQKLVPTPQSK